MAYELAKFFVLLLVISSVEATYWHRDFEEGEGVNRLFSRSKDCSVYTNKVFNIQGPTCAFAFYMLSISALKLKIFTA